MTEKFYIVDIRPSWRSNPYITFWRPDNKGYAYPLSWAGKYDQETIDADIGYYIHKPFRVFHRFPVRCKYVEKYGMEPAPGLVDGNAGPVVDNNAAMRDALVAARYIPAEAELGEVA